MIDPEPSYVEDCFELFHSILLYIASYTFAKLKKALHENKDDDGFGPTIKKAAKNPDGTKKDKWRTTGGATFEDNIQVTPNISLKN